MPITLDQFLAPHTDALRVGARRAELIARNLANADTPNYKARDIDFQRVLSNTQGGDGSALTVTHAAHLQPGSVDFGAELLYRVPTLPRLDGNTVDTQMEQAAFAENALRYSASLTFLDGRIKGLKAALRGE
ncbi:MAG: flagellar basal body rod protein FlgB [Gammaproteobacteria bacterium]